MTTYYEVHVFHSRNEGFSIPVKSEQGELDDDSVIQLAVKNEQLDYEDAKSVDCVESIDEETFLSLGGKL